MTDMAICTSDLVSIMWTSVPSETDVCIVTAEAHTVLCGDRCFVVGPEANNRWSFLAAPHARRVRSTRSVARFTL